MKKLAEIGIALVERDKLSVIPVGKDKIPKISWKEYQTRFATREEIIGWFESYPDAQLGIVTGKISNLTVVDIEEGGDPTFLPQDTFIVRTGGNGWHYYYAYQEGMQNKARIKPLIDIRSEGGYVVAPGSRSDKGPYLVHNNKKPATFPKELFKENIARLEIPQEILRTSKEDVSMKINGVEVQASEYHLVDSYPGYGKGQRNDSMTSFIGLILATINPAHWDTIAWGLIREANLKNTPPLYENELYNTFRSIKGREVSKTPVSLHGESSRAFVSDGSDEVKHIKEVADSQMIDQDDFYPTEMGIFDEVIDGGFSPGDIIIVAAPTGHGKTSLAQDWTMSFIRGVKKASVLWFSYEVMTRNLWKKFVTMGMTDKDLCVIPAKHTSGNVAWVEEKIKEAKDKFKAKIVVIDHLGFLLPKTTGVLGKNMNLNQSAFITQIVRDLKSLAIQEEVIIILPVHMRKTNNGEVDQESIKDSAGIAQEADCVFLIERERNKEQGVKEYYTEYSKITLSKNRKNGISPWGWFTMFNQRFVYADRNEAEERARDSFDMFAAKPAPEKEIIIKTVEPVQKELRLK